MNNETETLRRYIVVARKLANASLRRLPRHVDRDDIEAAAIGGVWDAILKGRQVEHENFDSYVRARIRGAIGDELRRQDWVSRRMRERANESGRELRVVLFESSEDYTDGLQVSHDVEQALDDARRLERVIGVIDQIPPRLASVVRLYFLEGLRSIEVAAALGVSQPRITQLLEKAVKAVRQALAPPRIAPPPVEPQPKVPEFRYSFETMMIGETRMFGRSRSSIASIASRTGKRFGMRFSTRQTKSGLVEVVRVA